MLRDCNHKFRLILPHNFSRIGKHPFVPRQRLAISPDMLYPFSAHLSCVHLLEMASVCKRCLPWNSGKIHGGGRGHHAVCHHRQVRWWRPDNFEPRRWHVRQGHVASVDESALEDRPKIFVKIFGVQPEETIFPPLRVLRAPRQSIWNGDILEPTIIDPGPSTEKLEVETTFPLNRAVDGVRVVRIESHTLQLAVDHVRSANEESVPLQIMDVDEQPVRRNVFGVEAASHTSGKVCKSILNLAASVEGLPASHIFLRHRARREAQRVDLGICLLHQAWPNHIREVL
mmetsp:Transcript_35370/g.81601  ORF Transcript_35370/g.81601 Transcript_35370/m.81601 type:complete len:286 (-) Transcript_35370:885-1742(-)